MGRQDAAEPDDQEGTSDQTPQRPLLRGVPQARGKGPVPWPLCSPCGPIAVPRSVLGGLLRRHFRLAVGRSSGERSRQRPLVRAFWGASGVLAADFLGQCSGLVPVLLRWAWPGPVNEGGRWGL
jgi:hypothetical protein